MYYMQVFMFLWANNTTPARRGGNELMNCWDSMLTSIGSTLPKITFRYKILFCHYFASKDRMSGQSEFIYLFIFLLGHIWAVMPETGAVILSSGLTWFLPLRVCIYRRFQVGCLRTARESAHAQHFQFETLTKVRACVAIFGQPNLKSSVDGQDK